MEILVIGAAGMIGRKLSAALLLAGEVAGQSITSLVLADMVAPQLPTTSIPCRAVVADLSDPATAPSLLASHPGLIFHLAAIVSGEAEADFDKGYAINLDGTRHLLEAIRREHIASSYCPRLVFTSSIAVFGEPLPPAIPDDQAHTPLTSYGTQKAICELLLADYSRRGFVDGIGIRLPTIVVRPGAPNRAASGFFSGIIREPLAGLEAVLPVEESVRHWFASPRAAVGFLMHAAALETSQLGQRRNLSMPGLSATVGEEIAALQRLAGSAAVSRIRKVIDPVVADIVAGWPQNFDAKRATALGFRGDSDFDAIIRAHIEDELEGKVAL